MQYNTSIDSSITSIPPVIQETINNAGINTAVLPQDSITNYGEALVHFVFEQTSMKQIGEMGYDKSYLVYISSACFFGFICLLLDSCLIWLGVTKNSFLGLDEVKKGYFVGLFILWGIGSGIVSWLGYIANVLQPTVLSSFICAVSWVYILKNLAEGYQNYSRKPTLQKELAETQ